MTPYFCKPGKDNVMGLFDINKISASLLKRDSLTKGIKVTVVDKTVSLDMHVIVEYGVNINTVCDSVISNVKYQVKTHERFLARRNTLVCWPIKV